MISLSRNQWRYLAAAGLFLFHQLAERCWSWRHPWIDHYLDDLLALPLLLGLWQWERRWLHGLPRLNGEEIVLFTLICAALFELGFPYWTPAFTADAWDVVAYLLGSFLFWWYNRPYSRVKA
jgi:hypothetical protein